MGDTLHDALTANHSPGDRKRVQWLGAVARLVAAALELKAKKARSKLASSAGVAGLAVELRALETSPAWADFSPPLAELTEAEAALREAALGYAEVRGRGDTAGAWERPGRAGGPLQGAARLSKPHSSPIRPTPRRTRYRGGARPALSHPSGKLRRGLSSRVPVTVAVPLNETPPPPRELNRAELCSDQGPVRKREHSRPARPTTMLGRQTCGMKPAMPATTLPRFLQRLKQVMADEALATSSDRHLLERFLATQDDAAFRALLGRHGPMVFRVCRRVLPRDQDAEDAFQASFLVLARQAGTIRKRASLASWLHGVARRVALEAREGVARRRKHEARARKAVRTAGLADETTWKELRSLLDEELGRLPERLRAPLVLCYLQGLTQDEAARRLGRSKATCRRDLERGREVLAARLSRRGVTLSAALFAPLLADGTAAAALRPGLVGATVEAAARIAAGKAAAVSAKVTALTEGVMNSMWLTNLKGTCAALFVSVALAVGAAGAVTGFSGAAPAQARLTPATPPPGPQSGHAQGRAGGKQTAAILAEVLRDADQVDDPFQKVRGLALVARVQHQLGDQASCRKTLEKAIKVADAMPVEDAQDVFQKFNALQEIAFSQSANGDWEGARRTIAGLRKAKVLGAGDAHHFPRAWALMGLARAQARAGRVEEALATVKTMDEKEARLAAGPAYVGVVKAQAKAKRWREALATAGLIGEKDMYRTEAFAVIARSQAEAGDLPAARQALEKALAAADRLPAPDPEDPTSVHALNARSYALQQVADAQAALGDARAAEQTRASLPVKESKQDALLHGRVRAGDFKAAREIADGTPPNRTPWDMGTGRDRFLAVIAVAQARAKDFKAAAETLGQIAQLGSRMSASVGVARELAKAGQEERAVKLLRQAVPQPDAVGPDKDWADDMRMTLLQLAAAQAEIGEEKAARQWIARLPSPFTRSYALLGVIEGLTARDGRGAKVRLFDAD